MYNNNSIQRKSSKDVLFEIVVRTKLACNNQNKTEEVSVEKAVLRCFPGRTAERIWPHAAQATSECPLSDPILMMSTLAAFPPEPKGCPLVIGITRDGFLKPGGNRSKDKCRPHFSTVVFPIVLCCRSKSRHTLIRPSCYVYVHNSTFLWGRRASGAGSQQNSVLLSGRSGRDEGREDWENRNPQQNELNRRECSWSEDNKISNWARIMASGLKRAQRKDGV